MKHSTWLRLIGASLLSVCLTLTAWADIPVPDLSKRVTDLTGTLSAPAIQQLEGKLADLETRKGSQIAVLLIPTLEGEDIASFGIRVADKWKIGRKGVDDGVILIVAKDDRKLRIDVGYGLEGVIPDAIAKRVIAETITPHFKQGDFEGGINAGVDQLIGLINGEALPAPARTDQNSGDLSGLFIMCLVGGVIAASVLSVFLGRTFGNLLGAGGAGAVAWALSGLLGLAVFESVLILFILGGLRGGGWSSGGGGFGGGSWSGGGGFGGGGGGWSGGGGGFGGGGSSGSW
jgi:uncharacterized protein